MVGTGPLGAYVFGPCSCILVIGEEESYFAIWPQMMSFWEYSKSFLCTAHTRTWDQYYQTDFSSLSSAFGGQMIFFRISA